MPQLLRTAAGLASQRFGCEVGLLRQPHRVGDRVGQGIAGCRVEKTTTDAQTSDGVVYWPETVEVTIEHYRQDARFLSFDFERARIQIACGSCDPFFDERDV